ncbi:transposase, MuDR, MULE transposase domain protein [Tanacetum coccineum]
MGESSDEINLYFVFEEMTFGVTLRKSINYNELVSYVKKKFNLNDTCDVMMSYKIGTRCIHIVDEDDVRFFIKKFSSYQGTIKTLLIKTIDKCLNSIPSSSANHNFDIKVPLFTNDSNLPKNETFLSNEANNMYETVWPKNSLKYIPTPPHPQPIIKTSRDTSIHAARILKKGDIYDSKELCMYAIGYKALLDGYQFKARKSDTMRYDVICRNDDCNWKIISKKCKGSSKWELGTVNDHHTCPKIQIGMHHRNATAKLLGHLLEPKFNDNTRIYKEKDIKQDIYTDINIDISYKKAWRAKNVALEYISGCPVASFAQLPYYCHILELANDGTVTHIETDDEDHFKIVFIAFGVVIRSFQYHMRPLIIIDASHLKGRYEGTNLLVVGMDGNNQIIPIAIGVSQGETGPSWTWFLSKLKECIGCE